MKSFVLCMVLIISAKARAFSLLTGTEEHNSTALNDNRQEIDCTEVDFVKQFINQGTAIGLAVAKNVHALVDDVDSLKQRFGLTENTINNFQQTIETLKSQINTLQMENKLLGSKIVNCESKIQEYDQKFKTVDENMAAISKHQNITEKRANEERQTLFNRTNSFLDEVKMEVKNLSRTHIDLSKTVSRLKVQAEKTEDNQLKMASTLASLEMFTVNVSKAKDDYGTHVAFTAGFGQYMQKDMSSTDMIFPNIITNVGDGYNPRDGVFTAPIKGSYVFYTVIVSQDNRKISTDIVLNGKSQVRIFAESTGFLQKNYQYVYQTGTNLVCLSLQSGDRVWVRRYSGFGFIVHPTPMHTFSGFLLHT